MTIPPIALFFSHIIYFGIIIYFVFHFVFSAFYFISIIILAFLFAWAWVERGGGGAGHQVPVSEPDDLGEKRDESLFAEDARKLLTKCLDSRGPGGMWVENELLNECAVFLN